MPNEINYDYLLSTLSKEQWKRIGVKRRSGVVAPLFSIYSSKSVGIGELPDLKLMVNWCHAAGMSIIQLLPMNDVDFNFRPYDAQSTFALDPMYLSLHELKEAEISPFINEIDKAKKDFPAGLKRVNYQIKSVKLAILWKIFKTSHINNSDSFKAFIQDQAFWLEDYALFKVIKEKNSSTSWERWGEDLKHRKEGTLTAFKGAYAEKILFHQWLQWQLYDQFKKVKSYAENKKILLMGDLPFLVSRDSADVWSHQDCFKLMFSAGAPPDMLFSNGQRWGMPPYDWDKIAGQDYKYLIERLKYAQNFYDLYRIDHAVGIFRIWSIPLPESLEQAGLHGTFDPREEHLWEEHGRKILSVMINNSSMLACAEDLGTIPACSYKVLEEFGIPGIDVQRWMKDWDRSYDFKDPLEYRKNATATISTHDMSNLTAWWVYEAGTVDEGLFKRKCQEKNIPFDTIKGRLFDLDKSFYERLRWKKEIGDVGALLNILGLEESRCPDLINLYKGSFDEEQKFLKFIGVEQKPRELYSPQFIKHALEKIQSSASIFSIQLLHDLLSIDDLFDDDPWQVRINFPGTLSDKNWTLGMPIPLDDMLVLPINSVIKTVNEQNARI